MKTKTPTINRRSLYGNEPLSISGEIVGFVDDNFGCPHRTNDFDGQFHVQFDGKPNVVMDLQDKKTIQLTSVEQITTDVIGFIVQHGGSYVSHEYTVGLKKRFNRSQRNGKPLFVTVLIGKVVEVL